MINNIFVNLPVKDLKKSRAFFEALGCKINEQFSDDTAVSVIIGGNIFAMLLTHEKWATFSSKAIADTKSSQEVILALGVESKEELNKMVDAAVKAGARETKPATDYGFMQLRVFEDLDGHHWEVIYMDPSHVQPY